MQIFKKKKEGEEEAGAAGDSPDGAAMPEPKVEFKWRKKSKSKDKKDGSDEAGGEGESSKHQGWDRFDMSKPTDFQDWCRAICALMSVADAELAMKVNLENGLSSIMEVLLRGKVKRHQDVLDNDNFSYDLSQGSLLIFLNG
ncbi:hypothetical protein ElyMa_000549600 [Elysia marginata]|uniref:Uncharacterized protein n=1 Tax=Elysia marginata TaxID=1093978 RepID=A0AAV4G0E6_9GAST|nr:hypothetical protein ElyMa_000549600 [Elysia marginata]